MFAADRSAEQPLRRFLGDSENRWRAGVRRFRRGWPRIEAGFALIGRGIGDLFAGLPAVAVIAGALLLVWLERNVALVRVGFSWLFGAHRVFFAALRGVAGAIARLWRPIAFTTLGVGAVLLLTPGLGALMSAIADWLAGLEGLELPRIEIPPPPELPRLPEWNLSEFWYAAGQVIERALYVVVVVGFALAAVLGAATLLAYALFTLYVIARGALKAVVATARAIVRLLQWIADAVLAVVRGAARAIFWVLRMSVRALAWVVMSVLRAIGWLARAVFGALVWTPRAASSLTVSTARGTWRLARAVAGGLARLLFGAARLVWRHVFRLFALSGMIAALAFTAWAVRSMREGRPLPSSLEELAASFVYVAAALLIVFSSFAILAAVALAIRHAPPRAVRAVGLAALVLLALAPTPFLARALWDSAPAQQLRESLPGLLTAALDLAPMLLVSLAALAVAWLVARVLLWVARATTRET
jgi:hypothetical protein